MTEWRRLPSPYKNYEVSDDGQVRRRGRPLKGQIDRYGYLNVNLYQCGMAKKFKVHRLVCTAFNGEGCGDLECAHLDGDRTNNSASNLAWVTRSENTKHQIYHGTFRNPARRGAEHHSSKLTDEQVSEMRSRFAAGESGRALARAYGVARGTAHRILTGKARQCAQTPSGDNA